MFYYDIKNFEVPFSRLIYGTWQLSRKGWKGVNLNEARETLHLALEKGVTVFDTAPIYGYGLSETILGEELNSKRKQINICSKCGLFWENGKVFHDNRPDSIERQINESLVRLKTDYLDIMFLHWPDGYTPIRLTLDRLFKLKNEKIIKGIGISNFSAEDLKLIIHEYPIDVVQYKYNYLEREVEVEILDLISKNEIKFWAYSPLAQGLLTNQVNSDYTFQKNDIRKLNPLFNKENFEKAIEGKNNLGNNLIKESVEFLINNYKVNSIIIGMSKKSHLTENTKYFKVAK